MSSCPHMVILGFVVILSFLSCTQGDDHIASLANNEDTSAYSQSRLNSVHVLKKRAPGWGKRSPEDDIDGEDSLESDEEVLSDDLAKRAPGWGKRTIDIDDYDKRAPGWGKRDVLGRLAVKRAPGWGKRDIEMDKRAPGWGKRAPGWGKRAPGWGKRAPGWGKRAPGWGKRAPGWGKRAPGWGKRSESSCAEIDQEYDYYIYKAVQVNQHEGSAKVVFQTPTSGKQFLQKDRSQLRVFIGVDGDRRTCIQIKETLIGSVVQDHLLKI